MLTPLLTQIRNDKNILQYLIVLQFSISILIPLIERLGVSKKYFGTLFNWPLFSSSALLYFCWDSISPITCGGFLPFGLQESFV